MCIEANVRNDGAKRKNLAQADPQAFGVFRERRPEESSHMMNVARPSPLYGQRGFFEQVGLCSRGYMIGQPVGSAPLRLPASTLPQFGHPFFRDFGVQQTAPLPVNVDTHLAMDNSTY
jgi:hypothetical protein